MQTYASDGLSASADQTPIVLLH